MFNPVWIRYCINEWVKLFQYVQLRILWFLIFIIPFGMVILVGRTHYLNSSVGPITDLRSKLSLFFLGIEMISLPLVMLTFFVGIQIEYRYKTFMWPVLKTIDETVWVWGKWIVLFTTYVILFVLSMGVSFLWFQLTHTFKGIDNTILQNWFWQLSFHFILLPIPVFLTMFLAGLILHRYSIAILVMIGLTFTLGQNGDIFAPFFALRYNVNLNIILLSGTVLWKYSDLGTYYLIAFGYSLVLVIIIQYIIRRIGIFRIFNT